MATNCFLLEVAKFGGGKVEFPEIEPGDTVQSVMDVAFPKLEIPKETADKYNIFFQGK